VDHSGARRCKGQQAGFARLGQTGRDPIPHCKASGEQRPGKPPHRRIERGIVQSAITPDKGQMVGRAKARQMI